MDILSIRACFGLVLVSMLTTFSINAHSEQSRGHSGDEYHHDYHTHLVGSFVGVTRDPDNETDSTVGIEYEYRFSKVWGLGGVYETTPDGHSGDGVDVSVLLLHVHPWNALRVSAGFGQEDIQGESESLARLAMAYDFHLTSNIGLAPSLNIDSVDSEIIEVLGLVLSVGF